MHAAEKYKITLTVKQLWTQNITESNLFEFKISVMITVVLESGFTQCYFFPLI